MQELVREALKFEGKDLKVKMDWRNRRQNSRPDPLFVK